MTHEVPKSAYRDFIEENMIAGSLGSLVADPHHVLLPKEKSFEALQIFMSAYANPDEYKLGDPAQYEEIAKIIRNAPIPPSPLPAHHLAYPQLIHKTERYSNGRYDVIFFKPYAWRDDYARKFGKDCVAFLDPECLEKYPEPISSDNFYGVNWSATVHANVYERYFPHYIFSLKFLESAGSLADDLQAFLRPVSAATARFRKESDIAYEFS